VKRRRRRSESFVLRILAGEEEGTAEALDNVAV